MRKLVRGCAVAVLVSLSAQSVARPSASVAADRPSTVIPQVEVGLASWYGAERQGKITASGEPFDMNGLTAAHRQIPLGTRVKVTNIRNHRTIVLRVNDRGPGIIGRIIDVSMAAAKQLGFLRAGLAPVQVEVVAYPRRGVAQARQGVTPSPRSKSDQGSKAERDSAAHNSRFSVPGGTATRGAKFPAI